MTVPTILVSGAGIAGPALAHWLTEYGFRVIVVELADDIRPGGQTVDLRGAGREVVQRMGLLDEMTARGLKQEGAAWVRSDGSRRAEMPVTAFHGNGLISKLEILRGDLVDALYQATKDRVEYRFGTRISDLTPNPDAVTVTLTDGTTLTVDMVVGADGPHSAVRRLVFGPEEQFVEPLGGYHAWFTAPDTVGLDGWYLLYQAPGVNASMRPSRDPRMAKAGLAFRSEPIEYDRHDLAQQRALLAERLSGAGWQCDELLAAAAVAEDFYFDSFAQVRMPTVSRGRVTLVGDAGYCASPLSGMGTSLALVGAYVLAGELGPAESIDTDRITGAFERYEALMRPYIASCQHLSNDLDTYMPPTTSEIAIRTGIMKWMQRWPFRPFAERKWFTTADAIELPHYTHTS
ncbi:FAD-dependent monooxygenase [Antrihabitans sp. YC2-6]|uniref:FAD-dependent monooxygenase n=1 Tax=Antrihabitans sp. YC2-6 TaxID=2799498 RepID=UPI0018F514A8|nr:FAD-dependent monooxygenase [Antrihabitans sp. YC2-6]MBJ8348641.1 FAD-dependent monooxygenase [Antrihabitans sp. YC2-6]